jgi:nicotinate-nucleotide adenylyltransferase
MKIALYFGSFNPIHTGHLLIANHILNYTDYKKVWFVVSPHNPLKSSKELRNEYARLNLVRLAIEDDPRLQACDIEFTLSKPSYTINTLAHLSDKHKAHEFGVIMGSDSFQNFENWRNHKQIIAQYKIIIYVRAGFDVEQQYDNQLILRNAPVLNISASLIRQLIAQGRSIRYLVSDKVREEIEKGRYYKKSPSQDPA